jgi:hypothetical protein
MVPVLGILPVRAIDDRVDTETLHVHARLSGLAHLLCHFSDPSPTTRPKVTGLADHDRAPVPVVDLGQ